MTIKFDVLNRWSRTVQFTAEIDCEASAAEGFKLRLEMRGILKSYGG